MNKNLENELKLFLSNIIENSNILDYHIADIEDDDDINFLIIPCFNMGNLKNENKFMSLMYCSDKRMLTIYCPTVYRLRNNDSIMLILNTINIVNSKIAVGKIYLNERNSSIISYINSILFNDMTIELTTELLEEYFRSFIMTVSEFYKQMKVDIND